MSRYNTKILAETIPRLNAEPQKTNSLDFIYNLNTFKLAANAYICFCNFNKLNYKANDYERLDTAFPEQIKQSVPKRQAEFLAGRFCASQALLQSQFIRGDATSNIPIGKNRSPIWPPGIIGSITHNDSVALAIVALEDNYNYVGIDVEKIMSPELSKEVQSILLNKAELEYLKKSALPLNVSVSLVFSAKEVLFKALHKYTQVYFGFEVAFVTKLDLKSQLIFLTLESAFAAKYRLPINYTLAFYIDEASLVSYILASGENDF